MATRIAVTRFVSRRFSSGSGKVLSEEEKAAENVYIKKMEKERLEKLAHKDGKPEVKATSGSGGPSSASASSTGASTEKVSIDKDRNYAVLAGAIAGLGALGWYLKSGSEKPKEVQD